MLGFGLSLHRRGGAADRPDPVAPGAPAPSQWTLESAGTGTALSVSVLSMPASGGAPFLRLDYSLDGAPWQPLGGAAPGTYQIDGLIRGQSYTVSLRAVNTVGPGPAGDAKTGVPAFAPSVPDAFAPAGWSLTDPGSGDALSVRVAALPADGGAPVERIDYRLDGGAWAPLGGAGTGDYAIAGLTEGQSYAVTLRAVNAVGPGPESDTKTAAPEAAAGGVPAAFGAPGWQVQDAGDGTLRLGLVDAAFPDPGGARVTRLDYRVDGGAWATLSPVAAPDPFAPGQWTLIDAGDGTLRLGTGADPADGNMDITGYEYRVDGGAWQTLEAA